MLRSACTSAFRVFPDCMCLLLLPCYPKRDKEKPCHNEWMYRLIWVFAGHTDLNVGFVQCWLIYLQVPLSVNWCKWERGSVFPSIWIPFQMGVHLTLKMPRKPASENINSLCHLLNILANLSNLFLHTGKKCGPRSDWSGSTRFAEMTFKITSRCQSRRQLLWFAVEGLMSLKERTGSLSEQIFTFRVGHYDIGVAIHCVQE